jgi:ornithine--oxo-acid transaminase
MATITTTTTILNEKEYLQSTLGQSVKDQKNFNMKVNEAKSNDEGLYYNTATHLSSDEVIEMEGEYAAHNYHPIPMVFEKAEGVYAWDPEGNRYYDFLSAYSATNQGHCHPKIVQAMVEQAQKCTLSSRAFYNSVFPRFAKYATEMFGYDMILPMNSGAEAVESALKIARKWGYEKKGISPNEAVIISARGCFHGRTIAVISMSSDPDCRSQFGPFLSGLVQIDYNDASQLREVIQQYGKNVCGFLVEPIQGEAGVVVPDDGYLAECYQICKENNVLFIGDEIQTGLARTGKLIACEWENVRPDILILGKAISGGLLPLSAVLADKDIMLVIKPGEHGSTYGGNPLASAVGIAALQVIQEEKLVERAQAMGEKLRRALKEMNAPFVKAVRGKGLLNAVVIDPTYEKSGWDICMLLKARGLLAKPTHENIIRFAPPLVITEEQMDDCLDIIRSTFRDVITMSKDDIPHERHH